MNKTFVSVVIPTYNAGVTVNASIESILRQTYRAFEIIVVDDGSTDDTQEKLQQYSDRIRYIYQENQERSSARNTGMAIAQGEFIAFLDADDTWLPYKLESQVQIMAADPEIALVYSQAYLQAENGEIVGLTGGIFPDDPPEAFYRRLLLGNLIPSPTPLLRRSTVKQVGGFDLALRQGEDWDYWLRVARVGKVKGIPEPLACYRVGSTANLLQRMAARGAQEAHIHILEKAALHGGVEPDFLQQILAQAWFFGALIDLGTGNSFGAEQRIRKAESISPGFLSAESVNAIRQIEDLASQMVIGKVDYAVGIRFIEQVASFLRAFINNPISRSNMLAAFYTRLFFQAISNGRRRDALRLALEMSVHVPGALSNRGIWTALFKGLY